MYETKVFTTGLNEWPHETEKEMNIWLEQKGDSIEILKMSQSVNALGNKIAVTFLFKRKVQAN